MEEYYDDVQEDVQEEVQEDFNEDYPLGNEEVKEELKEETKELDSGFSSKDVLDIIKAITGNDNETSEGSESDSDLEEVTGGNVDEEVPEVVDNLNESEIVTYDYTEILEDIRNEISSGNAEVTEQNYILGQLHDDSKPDTPIDSLSITNLLLICIFVLLLVDLLFKIIRGLF